MSLKEVRNRRIPQVEKIERAVDARLTDEANYWDGRAWELEEKEKQGKKTRLSSLNARRRADDLRDRRQMRLAELQCEKTITPATPRVLGGALVIPVGMLPHDSHTTAESSAAGRREVELAGMRASWLSSGSWDLRRGIEAQITAATTSNPWCPMSFVPRGRRCE